MECEFCDLSVGFVCYDCHIADIERQRVYAIERRLRDLCLGATGGCELAELYCFGLESRERFRCAVRAAFNVELGPESSFEGLAKRIDRERNQEDGI